MKVISRRSFLAASTGVAATLFSPSLGVRPAQATQVPMSLRATTRTIEVNGRAATVKGLLDGIGNPGLVLEPGTRVHDDLMNDLGEETIVHWHSQIPPNAQDGV